MVKKPLSSVRAITERTLHTVHKTEQTITTLPVSSTIVETAAPLLNETTKISQGHLPASHDLPLGKIKTEIPREAKSSATLPMGTVTKDKDEPTRIHIEAQSFNSREKADVPPAAQLYEPKSELLLPKKPDDKPVLPSFSTDRSIARSEYKNTLFSFRYTNNKQHNLQQKSSLKTATAEPKPADAPIGSYPAAWFIASYEAPLQSSQPPQAGNGHSGSGGGIDSSSGILEHTAKQVTKTVSALIGTNILLQDQFGYAPQPPPPRTSSQYTC